MSKSVDRPMSILVCFFLYHMIPYDIITLNINGYTMQTVYDLNIYGLTLKKKVLFFFSNQIPFLLRNV